MKRKGESIEAQKRTVYPRMGRPETPWSGKIERLAWGGKGVARAEDDRIILLSAPMALFPGEEVEASIHWKPRHGEGEVRKWIQEDPRRVPPTCPVAGSCGGCDLWGAGAEAGELKRLMVEDLFSRQLKPLRDWRWLPAPPSARRHRIQLHWDGKQLGFHRRASHHVIPIQRCPAAEDSLSNALPRLEEALRAKALPTKPQRWELATGTPPGEVVAIGETGRTWRLEPDGWHPWEGPIVHKHGPIKLQHRAGGFYQVCPSWAVEAFSDILRDWDVRGETLYDLFGGVGFFSALLGQRFGQRILVEFDAPAVAWARTNLEALDLPSQCIEADAMEWIPEALGTASDVLLLDPPRSGLSPEVCARLQSAQAQTLVLVGCDGAAFCRDVHRLAPAWQPAGLAAVDLFPLTHHVECVGLLKKTSA